MFFRLRKNNKNPQKQFYYLLLRHEIFLMRDLIIYHPFMIMEKEKEEEEEKE
jgi:hypothetical protein